MTLPGAQHGCHVILNYFFKVSSKIRKNSAVMCKRPLRWIIVTSENRTKIDSHFDKNHKQFVRRHENDRSTLNNQKISLKAKVELERGNN